MPHLLQLYASGGTFHWWDPQEGHLLGLPSWEFHVCPQRLHVTLR